MSRRWAAGAMLPALLGTAAFADPGVVRARYLMGTVFRFETPALGDPAAAGAALDAALDEVARLENVLSNWREASEVSRLNREAASRETSVSEDLYAVVKAAVGWARATRGAFDPTVEPQTRRFRAMPSPASPAAANAPVRRGDWRGVRLDDTRRTIRFHSGVEGVDLGGIAKGYALDRAAEKLRGRGISAALLDAGGQLLAMGAPPGEEGWSVAVADPADRGRPALPLLLRDASAATSGDSQRPGEIVDPADGSSIAWSGSVTVIHPEATAADALSTALFVLGPRRGLAWASHESDLLALYLERSGSAPDRPVVQSSRLLPPEGSIYFAFSPSIHQGRHLRVEIR